jgi:hypothetical protein
MDAVFLSHLVRNTVYRKCIATHFITTILSTHMSQLNFILPPN